MGSSNNMTSGFIANALAMATRCFCPPDRFPGKASLRSSISTFSRTFSASLSASFLLIFLTCLSPRVMLSITLRWANSSKDWKTMPIFDLTSFMFALGLLIFLPLSLTSPSVGSISRLIHLSTVDFPLPDDPIIATDSPSITSNEIPLTACTPPEYTLCMSTILSTYSI